MTPSTLCGKTGAGLHRIKPRDTFFLFLNLMLASRETKLNLGELKVEVEGHLHL